jgi:hypothetical protein
MIGRRKRLFHTAGSTTGKECGSGTWPASGFCVVSAQNTAVSAVRWVLESYV